MLKLSYKDKVDLLKYQDNINSLGYVLIDDVGIIEIAKSFRQKVNTLNRLISSEMQAIGGPTYVFQKSKDVIDFLIDAVGVPERKLKHKNVQNLSLNAKVLEKLISSNYVPEFLKLYSFMTSQSSMANKLTKLPERLVNEGDIDKDGKVLKRLSYLASERTNYRFNYKDYDVLAVPKEISKRYGVPAGYFLAGADMKQADLRIALNLMVIDESNYTYFKDQDDWYLGVYNMLCDFYGNEPSVDEFKAKRQDMKACLLSAVYGAESGDTEEETAFIREFSAYLMSRPKYKAYRDMIDEYLKKGYTLTLTTYFGNPLYIDSRNENTDSDYSGSAMSIRNKALNYPIQSATSEIIIHIVNTIIDRFRALGYGEEDFRAYIIRHDEPVFMISEQAMKDCWILEDCSKIYVDSWMPLELEFSYGYTYDEDDEELTEKLSTIIGFNEHKITTVEADTEFVEYMPLKRIASLSVGYYRINNEDIMIALMDTDNKKYTAVLGKSEEEDLIGEMNEIGHVKGALAILDGRNYYNSLNADIFSVETNSYHYYESLGDGRTVDFKTGPSSSTATVVAEMLAYRYCTKHNIPFQGSPNVMGNLPLLDGYEHISDI